jgi:hypothetical protein
MRIIHCVSLFACCAALSLGRAQASQKALSSVKLEQCLRQGGTATAQGMFGYEMCVIPYQDAGKSCSGHADCRGACIYSDNPRPENPRAKIKGICAPNNYHFGCRTLVEKGRIQRTVCVD